jgi:hypothetical protein
MSTDILELGEPIPLEITTPTPCKRRRWNSDHYPKSIVVRVTEDEHREINARAGLSRAPSTSRYLAECGLRGRAPELRETPPPTDEQRAQFERLLYELRKAGTNLNQLTYATNLAQKLGAQAPSPGEVSEALRAVTTLVEQIRERL